MVRSEGRGATWLELAELPVDGTSFDHPTLVVDTTQGSRRGAAYIIAGHVARSASGRTSLVVPALASSKDGGRTFSDPVRLQSTNVWAMVLSPVVLSGGSVGFGFVDYALDARPAGAGVTLLRTPRVWWAQSTDGGRTLSIPNLIAEIEEMTRWGHVAVDGSAGPFRNRLYAAHDDFREGAGSVFEVASCNDQPGNVVDRASGPFDVGARWPAGGDHFGLAAHPDGSFLALWADGRSGVLQLWTSRIHVRTEAGG